MTSRTIAVVLCLAFLAGGFLLGQSGLRAAGQDEPAKTTIDLPAELLDGGELMIYAGDRTVLCKPVEQKGRWLRVKQQNGYRWINVEQIDMVREYRE